VFEGDGFSDRLVVGNADGNGVSFVVGGMIGINDGMFNGVFKSLMTCNLFEVFFVGLIVGAEDGLTDGFIVSIIDSIDSDMAIIDLAAFELIGSDVG
jgi:hypothetical protein